MEKNIYHTPGLHIKRQFSVDSFDKFFLNSKQHFQQLSRLIKQCQLDDINCRFNVWRLCLGVISIQSTVEQKKKQIEQSRKQYQEKKDEALKSINKKFPTKQPFKKNPLMMMGGHKSTQNKQVESDEFLKQEIQKDVERTYQQMKFFQQKNIAKLLSLILFIWCRRNPDVSYKQGMNELLASVVVCYFKQVEFKNQSERPQQVNQELWTDHFFFNSIDHVESDIYAVFEKLIEIQGDMYKTEADLAIKSKVNPNSKNNTPILQRIMHIKDHKLKHMDLQLLRIIKLQDVQTKSFMLRWIRCMHTRQFDLENSFVIWDSIFLEFLESDNSKKNKQFQFIDAMCLAMFMYMRSIVFTKQTAGQILQIYQKYPALKRGEYLDELITLAWTICQELRIQSQNSQVSQSNWFEESQKLKSLHFMQKKPQQKPQTQIKGHYNQKKSEPVQKQLKQTEHKKQPQITKKHSQPLNHTTNKTKQPINNHHESNGHTKHQNKTVKTQQKQKYDHVKQHAIQKSKQDHKNGPIAHHKSEAHIQKQSSKQVDQNSTIHNDTTVKSDQIKQIKEQSSQNKQKSKQNVSLFSQEQPRSNVTNPSTALIKVPHDIEVKLSSADISQILQHLSESLPKIRDIDAQSHIRKTIKKIQGKVKSAKEGKQQQEKNITKFPIQSGQQQGHN